jgi:plastocyanin
MRRTLLLLTIALAALVAACSSTTTPGWTYAPPTEAPPSQAAPSGEAPSAEAPSSEPTSAPGGESPAAGGDVVNLTAQGIQFLETDLSAPADTPFVIRFDNQDAGVPHNVEIKDASSQVMFKGDIFNGVEVRDYQVPALPAGTYQFLCTVHPNMVGTLTVGG